MTGSATPALLLVGGGKMGGAMLEGWLKRGIPAGEIAVLDPNPSPWLTNLSVARGFAVNPAIAPGHAPETLVLAIKPQMLDAAAPALEPLAGPETLAISVLAGKTIADLKARMPRLAHIVRAMPNTPAAVGRGITGMAAAPGTSEVAVSRAKDLLTAIGAVVDVGQESLIDAVTAVSGSGPAYVFYLTECLARAGAALGLPPNVAAALARATVEGAGELMFQDRETSPEQLRVNVTSPGGTTAAALGVLMAPDGLDQLMHRAVAAAHRRAGELSG